MKGRPMEPSEMPYKRNGCDLCGRVAPLSRVELAPSSGSARTRNYKAPRVAYVCDAHPDAAGPVLRAPAATMAPGTHRLSPQADSLF